MDLDSGLDILVTCSIVVIYESKFLLCGFQISFYLTVEKWDTNGILTNIKGESEMMCRVQTRYYFTDSERTPFL